MKKIRKAKGWSIYEAKAGENDGYRYAAFLPDESPNEMCSPEWQADSMNEIIDFIESY
ncbi:hypothetical protein [Cohnella silvisoli]|uniref:Uncharacterized protein n=1 Tax=Cohnella silvisoli TaxID=2873699 RepID=A0ABV1L271_9BACL|nr:hypothetical protein [Cohnella silvisoli]MCD9025778.1 hypothetical protein [Cohnella silvisoli]